MTFSTAPLLRFLEKAPTAWHAVAVLSAELESAGFIPLKEGESWKIEAGGRYVVIRGGTSLCAFVVPKKIPQKVCLAASHTDSPGFKLKPHPEVRRSGALLLGLEIYGAPLLSSWLNRDLGVAGHVVYADKYGQLRESLVALDRSPVTLAQVAFHLEREGNDKGVVLNKQEHLYALAALEKDWQKPSFLEALLHEEIDFERLVAHELFLYPLDKPRLTGYHHAFLSAYRIDNLLSVYASLEGLLASSEAHEDTLKMMVAWDHEEIGSSSMQGAGSPFLSETLERLVLSMGGTREDYFSLKHRSMALSIDAAHAIHPNYPEKHDSAHAPRLGEGVVLKYNAGQRYATRSSTVALVKELAEKNNLNLQSFVSRGDIPCGSTVGPIHAALTGMPTVDIGLPQLSMHSSRELAACADYLSLCVLLKGFFNN